MWTVKSHISLPIPAARYEPSLSVLSDSIDTVHCLTESQSPDENCANIQDELDVFAQLGLYIDFINGT